MKYRRHDYDYVSLCGRVTFTLMGGSERLIIDNRDVYQGRYVDPVTHKQIDERPDGEVWAIACDLMDAGREDRARIAREAAARRYAKEAEYEAFLDRLVANTRGTAYDPNNY